MRTQDLKDFAINTGKFYDQHCAMAREGASARVWTLHVRVVVLPAYRKEFDEPYEGMSKIDIDLVAIELRGYYLQHLRESDAS